MTRPNPRSWPTGHRFRRLPMKTGAGFPGQAGAPSGPPSEAVGNASGTRLAGSGGSIMTARLRARLPFVMILLTWGSVAAGQPADRGRGLEINFVDVMGGAATLVVTPDRESVLIDSGWSGLEDRDPKRIAHVLKDLAGCDHLDHLVTTHWHTDHYGGVEGLAKRIRVDHFWDRGLPDLTKPDGDKANFPDGPKSGDPLGVAYRKASDGKRKALKAGDKLPLKGSIEAVVLASGGEVISADASGSAAANPLCASAPPDQKSDPSDNARSLVLRFRLGKFDFLDCGDLTWNVEKKL